MNKNLTCSVLMSSLIASMASLQSIKCCSNESLFSAKVVHLSNILLKSRLANKKVLTREFLTGTVRFLQVTSLNESLV